MPFNSVMYLLVFLPICAVAYYLIPEKTRKIYLLISSYIFYILVDQEVSKSLYTLGFLFATTIINYAVVYFIHKIDAGAAGLARDNRNGLRIAAFLAGIAYDAFALFGLRSLLVPFGLIPLGLSFYMFRCFSLIADVYLKKVKEPGSFIDVALYLAFFPQIGMGPINQFNYFSKQLAVEKKFDLERSVKGLRRIITGSFKKIVIADGLATFVDTAFEFPAGERTVFMAWMGAIFYLLQEFNDFSGYSDVSIGTGLIFGFESEENFNYPFASKSITEFWQRWHMSLGAWLKNYIYLPIMLKLTKPGKKKKISMVTADMTALFATWLLCGAWHGRGPKYILWGLYFFVFLAIEHLFMFRKKKKEDALKKARREEAKRLKALGKSGADGVVETSANPAEDYGLHAVGNKVNGDKVSGETVDTKRTSNWLKYGKTASFFRNGLAHIYALFIVLIGETLFRAPTLRDFGEYGRGMLGLNSAGLMNHYNWLEFKNYIVLMIFSIIASFPIIKGIFNSKRVSEHPVAKEIAADIFCLVLFLIDIGFVFVNTYSAFIYNQF